MMRNSCSASGCQGNQVVAMVINHDYQTVSLVKDERMPVIGCMTLREAESQNHGFPTRISEFSD